MKRTFRFYRIVALLGVGPCLAGCDPIYTFDKQRTTIIKVEDRCYAISFQLRYDFGTETLDGMHVDSMVAVPCYGVTNNESNL